MGSELKLVGRKPMSVQLKGELLTKLRYFRIEQAPSLVSGFPGTKALCDEANQSHSGNSAGGIDPQISLANEKTVPGISIL